MNSEKILLRENKSTLDGSSTLYIPAWDEHYHSSHGALQEAQHVFIENGLKKLQKAQINIVEFGFGTGLNAFLTCLENQNQEIKYLGIEKYPINLEEVKSLNYTELVPDSEDFFEKIHRIPWNSYIPISKHFQLKKVQEDFRTITFSEPIDLVYYDVFGFRVQPYLWESEIFQKIYSNMNLNGLLTTYCSKGVVRRTLQEVGFKVEKIPGPKGKREMINAWKR